MTWKSHSAIATALTLPFAPAYIPAAVLGSTAPDWLEFILSFFGYKIQHRGATHYVYIPIAIIVLSALLLLLNIPFASLFLFFGIGYLSHWLTDALTISGVPISGSSRYRVHFFGGRLRTGDLTEYLIAFGALAVSAFIFLPLTSLSPLSTEFNAYRMDYRKLYEQHIIDESEMLANRFKFF